MDERLNILSRWVGQFTGAPVNFEPASSDASFRRYFRVFCRNGRTFIVMDAPPERESVEKFNRVATLFREAGLNVPAVFNLDVDLGFALVSDLGDRTYLSALLEKRTVPSDIDALYADALEALWRLQSGGLGRPDAFDPYDTARLNDEMELFRQWFVPCRTAYVLSDHDHRVIDRTFHILTMSALEQPRVWVHRDFHSRNLMVTATDNPGVLDFQDAVMGPVTYDLVSLLRDCYITWPPERVGRWLKTYFERASGPILDPDIDFDRFTRWFDWMGVQRHVKVMGIFARLYHRDGKENYLDDLPVVIDYVLEVCGRYVELRPFRDLLASMTSSRER